MRIVYLLILTFLLSSVFGCQSVATNKDQTTTTTEKPAEQPAHSEAVTTINPSDATQSYLGDDKSKKKNKQPKTPPPPTPIPNGRLVCDHQRGCSAGTTWAGANVRVLDSN